MCYVIKDFTARILKAEEFGFAGLFDVYVVVSEMVLSVSVFGCKVL